MYIFKNEYFKQKKEFDCSAGAIYNFSIMYELRLFYDT